MINRFMDEVVSLGAENVLPRNLTSEWLNHICVSAKFFLREVYVEKSDTVEPDAEILHDSESALLLCAVTELLHAKKGYESDIALNDLEDDYLLECFSCYSILAVFEYLSRVVTLEFSPPEIDTVFDRDFILRIEEKNPQLTALLHKFIFEDTKEPGIN